MPQYTVSKKQHHYIFNQRRIELVSQGHFQLNTQASVNWVAADGLKVGDSRNFSVNVQPTLVWKKPTVQLAPLINVAQGETGCQRHADQRYVQRAIRRKIHVEASRQVKFSTLSPGKLQPK